MKKYKRLTERVGKGICIKETSTSDSRSIWNAIERLAELEDKIENGTLIELPCKVGDTVYKIFYSEYEARILELKVIQIVIQETIAYWCKTTSPCLYNYGRVKNEDFNKSWFLTKAEAEKVFTELEEKK